MITKLTKLTGTKTRIVEIHCQRLAVTIECRAQDVWPDDQNIGGNEVVAMTLLLQTVIDPLIAASSRSAGLAVISR